MENIKSFSELKSLPNGARAYHIVGGNIYPFYVIGSHRLSVAIVFDDRNVKFVLAEDFNKGVYVLRENYETIATGHIMIKQIREWAESEIAKITDVYLIGDGHNA